MPLEILMKLFNQIRHMLQLLMDEDLYGIDFCTTMKLLPTFLSLSYLTKKMQSTGTIVRVATETQESKKLIFLLMCRYDEALFDFDKAITLEGTNPVIYSNRGLVNRKMERFEAAIKDYS